MYEFAVNKQKLQRAISIAQTEDPKRVYDEYVKLAGKLATGFIAPEEWNKPVYDSESTHETLIEDTQQPEVVEAQSESDTPKPTRKYTRRTA